ncbi:HAMP domain-containing sensor histidine kinase [Embleya sp. NPDC005971]|uniref:sensor histidine kinase n=1 Tax=Embleya sp. NPDC005971 TaxID=3156724 RepID=UPI0033C5548E
MHRRAGLSARLKLTFSYAGFVLVAGTLMLAVFWVFVLRWVPTRTHPDEYKQEHDSVIIVTGPGRSELMRGFTPAAVAALAFLLVFGLVGGWILAGRMLAPLTRIADAARMASHGSLTHRIRLAGPNDEFRELADVFDTMLAQLEAHVAEQQRFAANASHELRTPLAIAQTLLDVARNDPDHDAAELIERLHSVNTRAIDLTEALLLLSRAGRRSFTLESGDLSLMAEETVETLLPLAEKHDVTLETSGDVTPALGSPALLLQLTTNLVHNAIVHNLPDHGTVWVHTSLRPDAAVLAVENTGGMVTPELASTLTEPFQRGTERLHADHAGVGLGLTIVKTITRAHNGTLTLTPRPTGGLRITVELPPAVPAAEVVRL